MPARREVIVTCAVLVQIALLLVVALWIADDAPHDVPVTVVAPAVVGESLVDRIAAAPGHPFAPRAATSVSRAEDDLRDGSVVAVVVVDLAQESDTALVRGVDGTMFRDVIEDELREQSASLGRGLDVRHVEPSATTAQRRTVDLAPVVAALLGVVGAVALTWWRGPYASTGREGIERIVVSAIFCLVTGGAVGVVAASIAPGGVVVWCLLSALVVATLASVTQALESIFGVLGIAITMTILLSAALPTLMAVDPSFTPAWWRSLIGLVPHGAGVDAARGIAFFDGHGVARPVWVLAAWLTASLATATLSRIERSRLSPVGHPTSDH